MSDRYVGGVQFPAVGLSLVLRLQISIHALYWSLWGPHPTGAGIPSILFLKYFPQTSLVTAVVISDGRLASVSLRLDRIRPRSLSSFRVAS